MTFRIGDVFEIPKPDGTRLNGEIWLGLMKVVAIDRDEITLEYTPDA